MAQTNKHIKNCIIKLICEACHLCLTILTCTSIYLTFTDGGQLIERAAHSGIILPGQDWHTITHNGPTASLIYRIRVVCDDHYYNTTCTKFCRPRNDHFGHYTCDRNGDKVCMQGWMGNNCEKGILFS